MVKLHTRETIELGADGYTEAEGYLIFSVLLNATVEEKAELETLWGVRYGPQWSGATVAKIPTGAVASVETKTS
ncbi:hypothetical protein [Nonomuraea glycinis]|uniref:hypothetical protein n=1 Tax=Nonomuraea glycinis TaxID=2047744 RepID=UPI0033B56C56